MTIGPQMLLTWSFGPGGAEAGFPVLEEDGEALDAVVAAATAIELDPTIDSVGLGGLPDADGHVSLDACVMTDPDRCGGVSYIRHYATVTQIARRVMEKTIHVLLSGEGAEAFAQREGFQPVNLLTDEAREVFENWRRDPRNIDRDKYRGWLPPVNVEELKGLKALKGRRRPAEPLHDTVGILGLDSSGRMAGACSTSGMAFKAPGRVGDSPIIGQGLYVDQTAGCATATGTGELIGGVCGSFFVVEEMRRGAPPRDAIHLALERIRDRFELADEHQVAFCAMTPDGRWATGSLRPGFKHTIADARGVRVEEPGLVLLQ